MALRFKIPQSVKDMGTVPYPDFSLIQKHHMRHPCLSHWLTALQLETSVLTPYGFKG